MKKLVNSETEKSVEQFLDNVENPVRREDGKALLQIMKNVVNKEPKMWGKNIVGFGKFSYQRKNGDEFEWFKVGFSPGKTNLTVYVMYDINDEHELLSQLGPHKTGKGCLYLKKLEDVDLDVLKTLIVKSDKWTRTA